MLVSAESPINTGDSAGTHPDPTFVPLHRMSAAPHIEATTAALEQARAARALPADDRERPAALRSALGSLRESWTPDHERHCRSGRQIGRTYSDDPVRVLSRERRAELARLRSALSRTSGTPREDRLPPWTHAQMRGRLKRFAQVLAGTRDEHDAVRRALGRGDGYAGMSALRSEAARLLEDLRDERRKVQVRWIQYERREVVRDPHSPYRDADQYDDLAHWLALLRQDADDLTSVLRRSATANRPLPVARRRWTAETALGALRGFEAAHGRKPRKADCRPEHGLPHYTQLRRLLGPRPLGG